MLLRRDELLGRVGELGADITKRLAGSGTLPLLVGVLKGSTPFLADLIRAVSTDVAVDFISISSYGQGGAHSGVVRIVKDLDEDVAGRDVIIVEAIVDTGLTLNYLRTALGQRNPRSLTAVALLDKAARRIVPVPLELRGFEIPDVFVLGYGLDWQGLYRNLPDVYAVRDLARLANDESLLVDAFTR
ncbi:hypoxanthine phosphoribosyltransferase [soil metagenome]